VQILFVTYGLPYPLYSGVRIHDFNLISKLSQSHQILLLSLLEYPEEVEYLPQLKPYCKLIDYVIATPRSLGENIRESVRCLIAKRPLATQPFIYEEMVGKIDKIISNYRIDIIQIEHSFLAPYIDLIKGTDKIKKILSFHNVGYKQYRTMLRLETNFQEKLLFGVKWLLMLGWEVKYAQKFDHCLVVSPPEKQLLKSLNSQLSVSVIENGVDTEYYQPLCETPTSNTLLFVGTMRYAPNVDAVLYFCQEIFPLIQHQLPDVKLFVVGHHPKPEICQLAANKNIIVTDYVPDVIPYYQQSLLSIVPLRAGGGTRLKILESMALGRPVVSTSLGCEGLEVVDGEQIMIADTPAKFASKTIQLLTDKQLREKISANARQLVEMHYDWSAIAQKLMELYRFLLS